MPRSLDAARMAGYDRGARVGVCFDDLIRHYPEAERSEQLRLSMRTWLRVMEAGAPRPGVLFWNHWVVFGGPDDE